MENLLRNYAVSQIAEASRVMTTMFTNVLLAFEEARLGGLVCIGLTGNRGGPMRDLCDYLLEVPSSDTPKIQEGHLVWGHIVCGLMENAIFKAAN